MRLPLVVSAALSTAGAAASLTPAYDNGAFIWREVGRELAPQAPHYTIRAGPVDHAEASAVSGTFQIHRAEGPSGIPSARLAGGCLEFLAADLGYEQMAAKQCRKNSDCSTPGENEFAACDLETKQCWSRPTGLAAALKLCNRGLIAPTNALIPVPAEPVDVRQFGIRTGTHVRVGACLNKAGINPQETGCLSADGADKIQVWGPVTRVR